MLHSCENKAETRPSSVGNACLAHPLVQFVKRLLALTICVGAISFLGLALSKSWSDFSRIVLEPAALGMIGVLAIAYAASFVILFASWNYTLRQNSTAHVPIDKAAYIYFIANIGKYLPGNIFHFAGRQILGRRAGWSHTAIAQATLLEIAAIVGAICTILLSMTAVAPAYMAGGLFNKIPPLSQVQIRYAAVAALVAVLLITIVLSRLGVFQRLFGVGASTIAVALLLCGLFFCVYAGMTMAFANQLPLGSDAPPAIAIGMAYLLAWLTGFAVPGAPGGLGVRESVLVLLLSGADDAMAAPALGLGLGMRLVSTLGDVICAASVLAIARKAKARQHLIRGKLTNG